VSIYTDVRFKGAKQVIKILKGELESPYGVLKRQENRMMHLAAKAFSEQLAPTR
jgi:hypothetical protein